VGPGSRFASAGMTAESLSPSLQYVLEGALARCALLDLQDGPAAAVVDDRNVEPGALFQKLNIALHVAFDRRQADQEKTRRHFHGEAGERRAAGLLGLLHQDARHVL